MDRLEGARLGDYELAERIGGGGMAEVYRAKQLTAFGREVAIKIIRPGFSEHAEFRARFLREAQAISRLSHPNILPLIEFGEERQVLYLVMPLVREGTLRDLLRDHSEPLPPAKAIPLFTQLCSAVQYAHTQGIIHRDIKPQNVLLQQGTHVLLADFGIARDSAETKHMTTTGAGIGTVEYMAPEQALGQGDVRSDIYSLGVVLYQMLTGMVPYSGSTPLQVLMRQTNEPLPDPRTLNPSLPPRLVQVLQTALAKDPNARFQSAQALAMAVQQVQTEMQAQPGLRPSAWMPGAGVSLPAKPAAPAPTPAPPYPGAALPYAPTSPVSLPPSAASGSFAGQYGNRPAGAGSSSPLPAESFNLSNPTGAFYAPPGAPPSQPGWSAPVSGFGAPPQQGQSMPPYAPGYGPPGFPGGPGTPAPRKNQTGLIAVMAALILIVVLGGSFVVLGANGRGPLAGLGGQQTPAAQVTPTPAATPTPTATPTPSAPPGYKVYINDPANTFRLNYPSDWSQSATSEGTGAQFVGTLAQVVIVTDLGMIQGQPTVLDDAFCEGSNGSGGFGGKPTKPVQVTLGGQTWTQEECDNSDHTLHAAVETIEYNSHTYLFTYVSPKPAFSLNKSQFFTPMEQSFKFLT